MRCDLTEYSQPNKDTSSNIAIEMTSLWHKTPCFIPMQYSWQDSEHHVWIVRKKSKKGERKGLIGLSEHRGRTFWGRSQAWNQQNSFNIPNPGGVAVLQDRRGREDECMRYDEIRAEGGGRRKTGWASDGTAGLASPGEHGGMRGGVITTPQRTKGGSECVCSYT